MTDIIFIKSSLLAKYVSKAIDIDAFEIEIECRDGYEEIIAMRNQMGLSIDRLDSESEEALNIKEQLYALQENNTGIIHLHEKIYRIKVETYQSFGEDIFRIKIKQS